MSKRSSVLEKCQTKIMETLVSRLLKEVNGKNRPEQVDMIEGMISENISDISKDETFYQIQVNNILSITKKTDFSQYEDADEILERIIQGTIKNHKDDKETVRLLQQLTKDRLPNFNLKECVGILESFSNIDLFRILGEQFSLPDIDYQCLLEQKTKEVESLKQQLDDIYREQNDYYQQQQYEADSYQQEIDDYECDIADMEREIDETQQKIKQHEQWYEDAFWNDYYQQLEDEDDSDW